jgi:hypothetical protein
MCGMTAARGKRLDFNTADERQDRQDLVAFAKPQGGVDARILSERAAGPGLTDNGDAATRPLPIFGLKDAQPKPTGR